MDPEKEEEEKEEEEDKEEEEEEVFSDVELTRQEEEEEEEDEEGDARIFNTWMQRCRGEEPQKKEEGQEGEQPERTGSRSSLDPPTLTMRTDRRASLPCPATLSSMQLSRLHSSTRAPVTANVLLRRSSSRRLLPSQQQDGATPTTTERRPSLISTIPEVAAPERRGLFRRRTVMSMSDAHSLCLICHNDLKQGKGGTRELECSHNFHKECIEEWLWRKPSCPTCHIHVSVPQSTAYWNSTRVKVP